MVGAQLAESESRESMFGSEGSSEKLLSVRYHEVEGSEPVGIRGMMELFMGFKSRKMERIHKCKMRVYQHQRKQLNHHPKGDFRGWEMPRRMVWGAVDGQ